mmetsp:Transcript_21448/g.51153  ORF Transcript_21448/g.51153 Transcript_21448/m.51153 type:complete len:246 (+) Transcript_21448:414-1151(+)
MRAPSLSFAGRGARRPYCREMLSRSRSWSIATPIVLLCPTIPFSFVSMSASFAAAAASAASWISPASAKCSALAFMSGTRAIIPATTCCGASCARQAWMKGSIPMGGTLRSRANASSASQSLALDRVLSLIHQKCLSGTLNSDLSCATALELPSETATCSVSATLSPAKRLWPVSFSRCAWSLQSLANSSVAFCWKAYSLEEPYSPLAFSSVRTTSIGPPSPVRPGTCRWPPAPLALLLVPGRPE